MKQSNRFLFFVAWIVALGWGSLSGCSSVKVPTLSQNSKSGTKDLKSNDPLDVNEAPKPKPLKKEVRLDGALSLGQANNLAFKPEELGGLLSAQAQAGNWNSVRYLIRTYPDIVADALLEGTTIDSGSYAKRIAVLYDRFWSEVGSKSWYVLYSNPNRGDFFKLRRRFLGLMKNGQLDQANALGLSKKDFCKEPSIEKAECLRLEGLACLLKEEFAAAEKKLGDSFLVFSEVHPVLAPSVGLLLGECYRKQKKKDRWRLAWSRSVNQAANLISKKEHHHPAFWTDAAFVKPIHERWPDQVTNVLTKQLSDSGLDSTRLDSKFDGEVMIWAYIGQKSLERSESQNAILAFKKAEAMISSAQAKSEFQLRQAKGMILGGQTGPATAILTRLGSDKTVFGDRAKSILATLKLQEGSLAQGMNLLQNAIGSAGAWPTDERLSALADYGLAYLMRGNESEGVSLLMNVHGQFIDLKEMDQAEQVLQNLATYYEKTEQPNRHRETIATIKKLNQF